MAVVVYDRLECEKMSICETCGLKENCKARKYLEELPKSPEVKKAIERCLHYELDRRIDAIR